MPWLRSGVWDWQKGPPGHRRASGQDTRGTSLGSMLQVLLWGQEAWHPDRTCMPPYHSNSVSCHSSENDTRKMKSPETPGSRRLANFNSDLTPFLGKGRDKRQCGEDSQPAMGQAHLPWRIPWPPSQPDPSPGCHSRPSLQPAVEAPEADPAEAYWKSSGLCRRVGESSTCLLLPWHTLATPWASGSYPDTNGLHTCDSPATSSV